MMGNVTEFHFKVKLLQDLPEHVSRVLAFANHYAGPVVENYDEAIRDIEQSVHHRFFKCGRWNSIFQKSAFHDQCPMFYVNRHGYGVLEVHGEFKNYDNDIQWFAQWLKPYLVGRRKRIYMGWHKGDYAHDAPMFHYWYLPHENKVVWGTNKEEADEEILD